MNTLLLGLAFSLNAPALKDPPKNSGGIVGEWIPESAQAAGKAGPKSLTEMRYHFSADGKWSIRRNNADTTPAPREFTLDLKADPKTIDVQPPPRPAGAGVAVAAAKPMLGIFKVDGDTLTICFALGGDERPKSFESADNARVVKMVFRRAKESDMPPKK